MESREIADYLDLARRVQNLDSDNKLARLLGVTGSMLVHYRRKRMLPSDETMLAIGAAAGIPAEEALLDLNRLRSPATGQAQHIYTEMLRKLTAAAFTAVCCYGLYRLTGQGQEHAESAIMLLGTTAGSVGQIAGMKTIREQTDRIVRHAIDYGKYEYVMPAHGLGRAADRLAWVALGATARALARWATRRTPCVHAAPACAAATIAATAA